MKNARPLILQRLVEILIDGFLVTAAFALAYIVRIGPINSTDFPFWQYFSIALILTPIILALFAWSGLYALRQKSQSEILRAVLFGALIGTTLFVLIYFFRREIFFSRSIIVLVSAFLVVLISGFHLLVQAGERNRYRNKKGILRTLVIGNGRAAQQIIPALQQGGSRFQPVAILAPYGGSTKVINGVKVMGKLDALERVTEEQQIDAILQTDASEHALNLHCFAEGRFLEFLVAHEVLGLFTQMRGEPRAEFLHIAERDLWRPNPSPLFGWGQLWKRLFDIFISLPVCILLLPFILAFELKKEERASGPQDKVFDKYEFANMSGFRKFLPEFYNVLRGDMSLIGPRPRPASERNALKLHERRRLIVRPGIFGAAQIRALRADVTNSTNEIEADIVYIRHWSFFRDMQIFWANITALFGNKK